MEYSGAGWKLIHEKNQKQKISCHCPFKQLQFRDLPSALYVSKGWLTEDAECYLGTNSFQQLQYRDFLGVLFFASG
jgi:hypothetical protein